MIIDQHITYNFQAENPAATRQGHWHSRKSNLLCPCERNHHPFGTGTNLVPFHGGIHQHPMLHLDDSSNHPFRNNSNLEVQQNRIFNES